MLTELQASEARYDRVQERVSENMGWGETAHCLKLAKEVLPKVVAVIKEKKKIKPGPKDFMAPIFTTVTSLENERLALLAVQVGFFSVVTKPHIRSVAMEMGKQLDNELFGRFLKSQKDIPSKQMRAIKKRVLKKHGSHKYRVRAIRGEVRRLGLQQPRQMTSPERAAAGGWLLDALLEALPDVFTTFETPTKKHANRMNRFLTITDEAMGRLDDFAALAIAADPVFLPSLEEPAPWKGLHHDEEVGGRSKVLVRSIYAETRAAVSEAIRSGQMQPQLDVVNRVQSVPFKINSKVLDVVLQCIEEGVNVPGLPSSQDIPLPAKVAPWDEMTDTQQLVWRRKASRTLAANRTLRGQRVNLAIDMETARQLALKPAFWCLHSIDWRGRLYPTPHFNFQREDKVRALFLFRDGAPIGDRGLYWLKVHTANCGDFGKISKRSFPERVRWVDEHLDTIKAVAADPFANLTWTEADKPFLFLAACLELAEALEVGPEFVTHLPCSWDGTCSGLQHLSAMSRAEEGALVNLTPSQLPQDVYQRVADVAFAALENDPDPLAQLCVNAGGNRRKLVKRNVMTFAYSATAFGMGQQHVEDTMEPLELEVLSGKLPSHPYGEDGGRKAAPFLAKHILRAIKQVVRKPAEVMGFLQDLARVMAHEGKVVEWTTPLGLPWSNRYHPVLTKRVTLWLHDRGVSIPYRANIADGSRKEVDKAAAEAAIAPNFVHACDAAHLGLTINAAWDEGIRHFATVHDSFGCLASESEDMHRIIRQQLVRMYEEHDVLTEVLERCKCALTVHNHDRLPNVVDRGSLELKDVLDARYAFA